MKLGQKLLLIMVIGMTMVTLSVITLTNIVAFQYIKQEEQRAIMKSYHNASLLLGAEARAMMQTLSDRAQNDTAYQFISNPDKQYVIHELTSSSLSNLEINYIVFFNERANLVYFNAEGVEPSVGGREKGELLRRVTGGYKSGVLPFDEPYLGLTIIDNRLLMIAGTPITTTDKAKSSGYLVMARYISGEFMQDMSSILGVQVSVDMHPREARVCNIKDSPLEFDPTQLVTTTRGDTIEAVNVLYDKLTDSAVGMHFTLSRDSYQFGIGFLRVIVAASVLIIGAISFAIVGLFNHTILIRIKKLSRFVDNVAAGRDVTRVVTMPGHDEVTVLAEHTNAMLRQISQNEETLQWQATHDLLSGLYNRHRFTQMVGEAMHTTGEAAHLGLVLVEMTNFKLLKTTRGQAAGDFIISAFGRRLLECKECDAISARMGRDEYAILINLHGECDVNYIANRLVGMLCEPIVMDGDEVVADINAGVAFYPHHAVDVESLFQCADLALTAAKADGNNIVRRYEPYMAQRFLSRLSTINDLGRALINHEFSLRYQPQVNAETGEIVGAEALLRWEHPEKGMIPPAEFIPFAEQSGKIIEIGRWVLQKACMDAMEWKLPWTVSINISAQQVKHPEFVDEVMSALEQSGLPPQRLVLEITESAFINDKNSLKSMLHRFRTLGIAISLDDFGTGYSSLTYLHDFPMDELKIDRSFVSAIGSDLETSAIIDTIIVLAGKLHLKIIAEGVENQSQASFLRSRGCAQFQGYLYSKPVLQQELLQKQQDVLDDNV